MSKILVVGNVMKDVYLNLDARTENFEVDAKGTKWLNVSFDAKDHHFFRRNSSYGGAAISLEVLKKMGISAKISGSSIDFEDDGIVSPGTTGVYRYILVAEDTQISYLTPSTPFVSTFVEPEEPVDFIYLDRSVELTSEVATRIECFLKKSPETKLALYFKKHEDFHERKLLGLADLVFSETALPQVPAEKLVLISSHDLQYKDTVEAINLAKPDLSTHLSLYSTAAATILGAYVLERPIEEGLSLARANIENSLIDSTLEFGQMKYLAARPQGGDPYNLELVARSLRLPGKEIFDLSTAEPARKEYFIVHGIAETYSNRQDYYCDLLKKTDLTRQFTGLALTDEALGQFTDDGRSFVDFLTDQRIVPGALLDGPKRISDADCKEFAEKFSQYREMGVRFIKWTLPDNEAEAVKMAVNFARCSLKTGLVPVLEISNLPKSLGKAIFEQLQDDPEINQKACLVF